MNSKDIDFIILSFFKSDVKYAIETIAKLEDTFFETPYRAIYGCLKDYFKKYKSLPSKEVALEKIATTNNEPIYAKIISHLYDQTEEYSEGDFPFFIEKIKARFNNQIVRTAITYMDNLYSSGTDVEVINKHIDKLAAEIHLINKASVFRQGSVGMSAKERWEDYYDRKLNPDKAKGVLSGYAEIDMHTNGLGESELMVISGPSGCHRKGQKILMSDGSLKNVEDLRVGDRLVGLNGEYRTILSLVSNEQDMVEIVPKKGESFVVNLDHILSLKNIDRKSKQYNQIVDVKVSEWLTWSKNRKNMHKLFYSGEISFENRQKGVPLDPYFFGLLLGDGSFAYNRVVITNKDQSIIDYCRQQAHKLGLKLNNISNTISYYFCGKRKHSNVLIDIIKELGLINKLSEDKFIPFEYKTASKTDRLNLLAGLIDTDGSLDKRCNVFDYITKSKQLSEDIVFICRSLGFAAYVKECTKSCQAGASGTYYRIRISGNIDKIPTKIEHKKARARKQLKNHLHTSFAVNKLPKEKYYGFSLDGDGRFLLDSFIVTHNTGKSIMMMNMAINAWMGSNTIDTDPAQWRDDGKNVLYVTIEMPKEDVEMRMDANIAGINFYHLRDGQATEEEEALFKKSLAFQEKYDAKKKFWILDIARDTTVGNLEAQYQSLLPIFEPDLIVVDYIGIMKASNPSGIDWLDQGSIAAEMHEFCRTYRKPVITGAQMNKAQAMGNGKQVFDVERLARSKMIGDNANVVLQIEKGQNFNTSSYVRLHLVKNRSGESGRVIDLIKEYWRMRVVNPDSDFQADLPSGSSED